ncbi:hypothetical protein Leryth_018009 [Lithospermum erythrorhizon]|nr:hypothetical protein Leryth_018009 [Lithospermum erythrorhizon]
MVSIRLNLCVPGCTRLSIEGVVKIVKDANSNKGAQGIKSLRIGGLYGVTNEHFEELKLLLRRNSHYYGYFKCNDFHRPWACCICYVMMIVRLTWKHVHSARN